MSLNFGTIPQKKADKLSDLIPPPPDLPRQGGGVLVSLPWREGLREGGKMAFTFIWVIGPLNFE
jgi:hypothetical protein